jgi:hypothetical protein
MTEPAAPDPQPGTTPARPPPPDGAVPPMPSEVTSARAAARGRQMAQGDDAAGQDGTQNPPPPVALAGTRPSTGDRALTHPAGPGPGYLDRKCHGQPGAP